MASLSKIIIYTTAILLCDSYGMPPLLIDEDMNPVDKPTYFFSLYISVIYY